MDDTAVHTVANPACCFFVMSCIHLPAACLAGTCRRCWRTTLRAAGSWAARSWTSRLCHQATRLCHQATPRAQYTQRTRWKKTRCWWSCCCAEGRAAAVLSLSWCCELAVCTLWASAMATFTCRAASVGCVVKSAACHLCAQRVLCEQSNGVAHILHTVGWCMCLAGSGSKHSFHGCACCCCCCSVAVLHAYCGEG